MGNQFDNKASHCLFIGDRNLAKVIAQDEREIMEIGGSFDAIANRMDSITEDAQQSRSFPYNLDSKVRVISYVTTRGMQECPFNRNCRIGDYLGWNEDVKIESKKTGKKLTVNSGTAHLAREHHLLEKDNEYSISAREFYESFM